MGEMTIEEILEVLGDRFRGLWQIAVLDNHNRVENGRMWSVTIKADGDYAECHPMDTPLEALHEALLVAEKNPA